MLLDRVTPCLAHADEAIVLDCGSQIFMRLGLQTGDDPAHSAQPDMQALVQQMVLNRIPAPGLLRIDQVATVYSLLYTAYSLQHTLYCLFCTAYSLLSTLYCILCTVDCLFSGSCCLDMLAV